jgi:hypothetical protein
VNLLILIPLCYTLTFVLTWLYANVWAALLYVAALPLLSLFAWYYYRFFAATRQAWRCRRQMKSDRWRELSELRADLHDRLDYLLIRKQKAN